MKTEQEMRDEKEPSPSSEKELMEYIRSLVDREHDYGTCVYAMSLAAAASFRYVAKKLGVTGFQASCADLDIIKRTRNMKYFCVQDYGNLLYPQYCDEEHFPTWQALIHKNAAWLKEEAKNKLAENTEHVHPNVRAHWEMLARLEPAAPERREP